MQCTTRATRGQSLLVEQAHSHRNSSNTVALSGDIQVKICRARYPPAPVLDVDGWWVNLHVTFSVSFQCSLFQNRLNFIFSIRFDFDFLKFRHQKPGLGLEENISAPTSSPGSAGVPCTEAVSLIQFQPIALCCMPSPFFLPLYTTAVLSNKGKKPQKIP